MKYFLLIFLLIFAGCSMLPATSDRFSKNLKSQIGNKERGYWGQKIVVKDNKKEWYFSYQINSSGLECKYIKITNLSNIIIGYRVLTPNICKLSPATLQ